jgi:hypothetical protein
MGVDLENVLALDRAEPESEFILSVLLQFDAGIDPKRVNRITKIGNNESVENAHDTVLAAQFLSHVIAQRGHKRAWHLFYASTT